MTRSALLHRAVRLSWLSIGFGLLFGGVSVSSGLIAHSLGVLAAGLAVLADVTGSIVLVWRFRVEQHQPERAAHVEARAAAVIAAALGGIAVSLAVESIKALINGTHPGSSVVTIASAAGSIVVLIPLALAKRRTAYALNSDALKGDSTLSAIGASTAILALLGLALFHAFGWWWSDRVVALVVAAVAAGEAYETVISLRAPKLGGDGT
jgi:divalent metal cation (Fe/Co/Zn/Cd) transporter